ncbi:hypothetical protein GCM10009022_03450 [Vreelandella titanicae]|jgi:hypothetical protein
MEKNWPGATIFAIEYAALTPIFKYNCPHTIPKTVSSTLPSTVSNTMRANFLRASVYDHYTFAK